MGVALNYIAAIFAASASAAAVRAWRYASPTNVWPQSTQTVSGGTKLVHRTRKKLVQGSGNGSVFRIGFPARFINVTVEQALGNDVVIPKCSVATVGSTVAVPVLFSGQRNVTIVNGTYVLWSDPLYPSQFASLSAGGIIPQGQEFYCTWDEQVPTAGQLFLNSQVDYTFIPGELSITLDPATFNGTFAVDNYVDATTGTATFWTQTKTTFTPLYQCQFVTGDPPTWAGIVDSLGIGQGDTTPSTIGTTGGFRRGLHGSSGAANPIGGITVGQSGTTPQWLSTNLRNNIFPFASNLYFGAGANYWLTSPGTALSLVQTAIQSIMTDWYASEATKNQQSVYARMLTPRNSYLHASSGTNVGTAATMTSLDGIAPPNGTTVTQAGHTPAAYNGTFVTSGASGSNYNVTLLSDPGGPTTVNGTWDDNGVNAGTMVYLNPTWGPEGTAPNGNARFYNDWLLTQIGVGKLKGVMTLPTNRQSSNSTLDGFYKWNPNVAPSAAPWSATHPTTASAIVEAGDMRPTLLAP